jgi:type IV pilus assembly protein PilB
MVKRKLGELLEGSGHISAQTLVRAIEEQKSKLTHLGEVLFENSLVEKEALVAALTEVMAVAYVDCENAKPDPAALQLLPSKISERYNVLPLRFEGRKLVLVMSEPQDLDKLSQIRFSAGCDLSPRFGFKAEIARAIRAHYGTGPLESQAAETERAPCIVSNEPGIEFFSNSKRQSNIEAMRELQAEMLNRSTPAVTEASAIVQEAIRRGASDIHIEPLAGETVVRMRLDGILQEARRLPRQLHVALVSRVKILCDMDIAERRAPQDGRFMAKISARQLDVRVSTLPTQFGEKIVMRLLDGSAGTKEFSALGFPEHIRAEFAELLELPQGMILVTGPTGSGKSSTLCASICALQKPSVNIVTVEDPVEYEIPGVNQVSIHTKAGMTFAGALRSILRQDPNIIMVGEIRDCETAEIAMKATQTGHLVLSTLHTNGAAESVIRLLDLGVPGYLIAASLTGILAQRLVRTLCSCHAKRNMTGDVARRMIKAGIVEPPKKMRVPVGCPECNQTGYKGRVGLFELFVMQETLRDAVRSTAQVGQLRMLARSCGMKTLREDGLDKIVQGMTTLDEILRVVPKEMDSGVSCDSCGLSLISAFQFCPYCGTRRPEGSPDVQPQTGEYAGELLQ